MQLEANHISYGYSPKETVLHDVSLSLKTGETLYILGRNGSGKTTLLSCLAGLLEPDMGEIVLDRKPLGEIRPVERSQLIGLIPQSHIPAFAYSVEEMVMMGRAPYLSWLGSPTKEDQIIVAEALEQVGLSDFRERPYTQISGGERQLVLIARGLAQKCQILLMDEPTAHLDLSNQHRILEIVQQLSQQGLSFIISTHAPNDALSYADKVLLLTGGWVTKYGPPKKTLTEDLLSSVYGIRTEVIYQNDSGKPIPRAVVPRRPEVISPESLDKPGSLLSDVFIRSKEQPQLIIVTGLSGAGKTTWCSRLIKTARSQDLVVRGILSPGIYKGGKKIGIAVEDLDTGDKRKLANLREKGETDLTTPRWSFNLQAIKWANHILGTIQESDLVVIDELGPLEFIRNKGLTEGLALIDEKRFRVASVVVRSSLLPTVLQRWPNALVVSGRVD